MDDNPTLNNNDELKQFKIQELDRIIKFRSLNRDHNFIFIKNKNSIQVLEPIKLLHIYSFHHDKMIVDFVVSPKDSSLILCTSSSIETYELKCANLSDYQLKIKYQLKKAINIENILNLSSSSLGDVIAAISKHRHIKLFDNNLNSIKTFSFLVSFLPPEIDIFPLDVFQITYDTRNIILCKYNYDKLSLIYKTRNASENDDNEYVEKIIGFREKIIYLKEYQKDFSMYIDYQDSSLFFIMTKGLNFLIMRKVYERDPQTYDLIPDLITFLYIDLSTQTENIFPFISFSLIYDNENPIFKGEKIKDDYQSGIANMDRYYLMSNKNTLNENENSSFLNYNEYYLKNVSSDYILFNFSEHVILYQINGLQSPPFNNPTIDKIRKVKKDDNYDNSFTLLKVTKTLDRNYSIFFVDKHNSIRKFLINGEINLGRMGYKYSFHSTTNKRSSSEDATISIFDSGRTFTMLRSIHYAEYNEKNRKTLLYEKEKNDSLITFMNSKLEFSKMIVMCDAQIENIHWVKSSNYIFFTYYNNASMFMGIINIYSKHFNKNINLLTHDLLMKSHITISIGKEFYSNDSSSHEQSLKELKIFMSSDSPLTEPFDKKLIKENDSLTAELLIQTDSQLSYSQLEITSSNKAITSGKLSLLWSITKSDFSNQKLFNSDFIFLNSCIYYIDFNSELKILNIIKISKDKKAEVIFQTVIFKELLYQKGFLNNHFIFITTNYINAYDITNRTFYRVRNDFQNIKEYSIDLFKCGIYLFLLFLSEKGIQLVRVPKNKNSNESFSFEFTHSFDISKDVSKISFENDMAIFNESQVENLSKISQIKHNLLFESTRQELILLNSNANSLFDCETFLDFFLSDNEENIKIILNLFTNLFEKVKDNFKDVYKNSKFIPNFLEDHSINYVIKIIFENDLNVLSTIGKESEREKMKMLSNSIEEKETEPSTIRLKFKTEEDDQEKNPIKLWCKKSQNLIHLKYTYDLISSEDTRGLDNFTKYFMLKLKTKSPDFENGKFKMSTADLCWVSLINNQQDILKFIFKDKVNTITWKMMTLFNIPLWIKSDIKLKELLEHVARNEYKRVIREEAKSTQDKTPEKNFTEHIALYFYLADKQQSIIEFYEREPQNEKIKKFIMRDFSIPKNRKIAKENADTLMNKKKYIYAAYFYLLADDIRSALDMTLEKMGDINLTVCLLRLVNSKYQNDSWKKYYSLEKIYQDYFINFGSIIRDPWLVSFGYIGQDKIDCALEYILNYDLEYTFEENKEIYDNIEDYKDNLEKIRKICGMNVFDYKILFFAKSLEKVYLAKLKETQNEVKNIENTNFEDMWDMEDDDDQPEQAATTQSTSSNVKQIQIDYTKITKICLTDSLKRGALYAPIMNLYKLHNQNSYAKMDPYQKKVLKSLISDRIVLDALYGPERNMEEKFLNDIKKLFAYLETNSILPKKEMYEKVNSGFLFLDEYKAAHVSCIAANKVRSTLIWVTNYTERLMSKNIYLISNFNFEENVSLDKIKVNINKLNSVAFFLKKVVNLIDEKNEIKQDEFSKCEMNLYIFRIIFMIFFYLLFSSKIVLKYNMITKIYQTIEELCKAHAKIEKFSQIAINKKIDELMSCCVKVNKRVAMAVKVKSIKRDEGLSFFIQYLNFSVFSKIYQLLDENSELSFKDLSQFKKENDNHYFHAEFKFISFMKSLALTYITNFDKNMEKYIKNYMKIELVFDVHNELKNIYCKHLARETNYFKYEKINIKELFKKDAKLTDFEYQFQLGGVIKKYISSLCKKFKYELKEENEEDYSDNIDESQTGTPNYSQSNYSTTSIKIVQDIFQNGYEIATFKESEIIQGFAINNCDFSNMVISTSSEGHRKTNVLYNLLVRSRKDDLFQLQDIEPENWEEIYNDSFNRKYNNLVENQMEERYKEILSIIKHDMIKETTNESQFPLRCTLPPEIFNELQTDKYLECVVGNSEITSKSFCKIIEAHPQLPLYATAHKNGVVGLWSFNYNNNKILDEFRLERESKETKFNQNLTRLKFSSYGNEFLACNQEGDLFIWGLEHTQESRYPKLILKNQDFGSIVCKDACFLNNTGILASTSNKGDRHRSYIWDMLLPLGQSRVGEIYAGGNLILPISTDSSFAVVNDKPGYISFVDIRKMEVVKNFQAHNDEIKSIKLSPKEKFMITFGKDSYVKIWDMTNKTEPLLIESFQPFVNSKSENKSRYNLLIANEFLFASKDNSIKMLRNKII